MHYRLYLIGPDGHFAKAVDLECEDDDHAWQVVRERAVAGPVELWTGARRVGRLEPGGAEPRR